MSGLWIQELARTETAVASAPPVAGEPLGAMLGAYQVERELGAGAMGVVYAAFDPELGRRIAIKVLRNERATAQAKERLLREARAMARLSHTNVATVYEVGTDHGRDFVVMELIDGETLGQWLRLHRPARAILDAFLAAGCGLAAAHAAGIVHCDFKPHNVLRSREGRIVVTDFGLAHDVHATAPNAHRRPLDGKVGAVVALGSPELTVTGALLGTPPYMAPEQWSGARVTAATDQFAYCVALWEALAGERPFRGPTLDDFRRQTSDGPATLDASRLPRWARGALLRGMDPDPGRRWPSMQALLARLAAAPTVWRPRMSSARHHYSQPRTSHPAGSWGAQRWSKR